MAVPLWRTEEIGKKAEGQIQTAMLKIEGGSSDEIRRNIKFLV